MWGWLDHLSNGAATFLGALAGAGLGLVAILLGAMYNAHLNRKRDDRLRNKEAEAVALALREELQMVQAALLQNAKVYRDSPNQNSAGPDLAHRIKVFPHVIQKLGLLNKEAIAPVIEAYVMIEQHGESLFMLGAQLKEVSGRRLYILSPEAASHAAKMNERLAEDLKKAIDLLSKGLRRPST
jgi:hypothetical protein